MPLDVALGVLTPAHGVSTRLRARGLRLLGAGSFQLTVVFWRLLERGMVVVVRVVCVWSVVCGRSWDLCCELEKEGGRGGRGSHTIP